MYIFDHEMKDANAATLILIIGTLVWAVFGKIRVNTENGIKEVASISYVIKCDESKLYSETISGIEMIETIKSSGAENGFFAKLVSRQQVERKNG